MPLLASCVLNCKIFMKKYDPHWVARFVQVLRVTAAGFSRLDAIPIRKPIVLEHWRKMCIYGRNRHINSVFISEHIKKLLAVFACATVLHRLVTGRMSMSKTFMGSAVCWEFKLEVLAAEEMLDSVICRSAQFSFQMCLESGDGSGTFRNWRQRVPGRQRVPC